jgi:hypothetical protein
MILPVSNSHRLCQVLHVSAGSCSPLQNNLLCCLLMICYTKACLEGIAFLRRKLDSAQSYSKQLLYATLSSNVLFWSLFDTTQTSSNSDGGGWSWRLNIVVPTAMLVRFIYKVRWWDGKHVS